MASAPPLDLQDFPLEESMPLDLGEFPIVSGDMLMPTSGGISILAGPKLFDEALRAEWAALAAICGEPNPFFEPWFVLPSIEALEARHAQLFVLRAHGSLVGVMPLVRPRRYYGYVLPHTESWLHDNAFCGAPLIAPGYERRFWRSLLGHLDRAPGLSLFLHLIGLPEDGPALAELRRICGSQRRLASIVHREERALLQTDFSAEDYFAQSMSAKKRKELRRQHNRLSELGDVQFERLSDASGIEAWIAEFLELEAAGWKGRQGSALADDYATRTMFSGSLRGAAEAGRLERLALRLNGRAIAMLANFVTPPGAYSFKTAFDEEYSRYSPGVLLQRKNLELIDRADIDWFDSCAATNHPMIDRIWREKRPMVRVNIAIGGKLRRTLFRQIQRAEQSRPLAGETR